MVDQSMPEKETPVLPDETRAAPEMVVETAERSSMLQDILVAAAGKAGEGVETAVSEFLSGKGELLDVVTSSLAGKKTAAKKNIACFLSTKFGLSADVALVVASLLLKVAPSLGKLAGETTAETTKPRRKKKVAVKSAKKAAKNTRTKTKPKKKTAASARNAAAKKTATPKRKPAARKTKRSTAKTKK